MPRWPVTLIVEGSSEASDCMFGATTCKRLQAIEMSLVIYLSLSPSPRFPSRFFMPVWGALAFKNDKASPIKWEGRYSDLTLGGVVAGRLQAVLPTMPSHAADWPGVRAHGDIAHVGCTLYFDTQQAGLGRQLAVRLSCRLHHLIRVSSLSFPSCGPSSQSARIGARDLSGTSRWSGRDHAAPLLIGRHQASNPASRRRTLLGLPTNANEAA